MNVLLIYPQCPDTFWSFKHALRFISKKAAVPPLGLITVSAMLPTTWNKKLIDLNITELNDKDLLWADYVFLSGMYVQRESINRILQKCRKHQVKIVAGGPLFTQDYKDYPEVDHFVLNEAEITLPIFLSDVDTGVPKRVYQTRQFADLTDSPIPDYHLLDMKAYAIMNLQVSRGCPFACDFCEITSLLGHKVRVKNTNQIISELETLEKLKWRGTVSIVDDNFIGNKKYIKTSLLPQLVTWMRNNHYPFNLSAQTSINLSDDDALLTLMREAGFVSTFIGIETPDEDTLQSCHKTQNKNRDLLRNVMKIQQAGMQVSGGFIVGFDSDVASVFQRQINFIQNSGIVSAMVGLLNAPKNTRLYQQMEAENRLTSQATGSNTDYTMNFTPKMNKEVLMEGYQNIIRSIYSVKPYYKRLRKFLQVYKPARLGNTRPGITQLKAFLKAMLMLGLVKKGRKEYWKFLFWTLIKKPGLLIEAVTFTVYGYHFRTTFGLR